MSLVPIVTIPESSYDISAYNSTKSKSQLLIYLIKLANGSSILLTLSYLLGYFALKPVLEITMSRRLELLDALRNNLRDCYLKLITKVDYIPIVSFNKNGKVYADEIIQTEDKTSLQTSDKLSQNQLYSKMNKLLDLMKNIRSYDSNDFSNYNGIKYSIKNFQNKSDLVYFNEDELFVFNDQPYDSKSNTLKKKNVAVETKNEIRGIKGLFMSGQV